MRMSTLFASTVLAATVLGPAVPQHPPRRLTRTHPRLIDRAAPSAEIGARDTLLNAPACVSVLSAWMPVISNGPVAGGKSAAHGA